MRLIGDDNNIVSLADPTRLRLTFGEFLNGREDYAA
jgi:hypothetical protein